MISAKGAKVPECEDMYGEQQRYFADRRHIPSGNREENMNDVIGDPACGS